MVLRISRDHTLCTASRWIFSVLLFDLILFTSVRGSVELRESYLIGGWLPGTEEQITAVLKPLLETYLNEEIAKAFEKPPKLVFRAMDFSEESYSDRLFNGGKIDFMYSLSGRLACIEPEHGFIPIATQRAYFNGFESGAQGTVIFSLKSNQEIQNISDFRGKRIGVGFVLSSNSYHLGYKAMLENGVNLFTDTAQFTFYDNDYEAQLQDVLKGHLDAGFLPSFWLLQNHADLLPYLRIHNAQNLSYESEPFPFVTSTPLVPQYGVAASSQIPWRLKQVVAEALMRLNSTHPAARGAGVATFTVPASYGLVRSLLEDMGLMEVLFEDGSGGECIQPFESLLHTMHCPQGFVRQNDEVHEVQCARDGLDCPDGRQCFCRPCVPDLQVEIFSARVVLSLCCTLLILGLLLSAGWVCFLEAFATIESLSRSATRYIRGTVDQRRRKHVPPPV